MAGTVTTAPAAYTALEPRADPSETPELCGFLNRVTPVLCPSGETCKLNTDIYAFGCCQGDTCNWQTTCCDYSPTWSTATWGTFSSICGGIPSRGMVGYCHELTPFCVTRRFENGFTSYFCTNTNDPALLRESVYSTSGGMTAAWPGLPRLTGSLGAATTSSGAAGSDTIRTTTATVTEMAASNGSPSPGVIAGSVVGGAVFGAMATLLAILLTWYFRNKTRAVDHGDGPSPAAPAMEESKRVSVVAAGAALNPAVSLPRESRLDDPYLPEADSRWRHELPGQPSVGGA